MLLRAGMTLGDRYTVGRALGVGGFGVTYLVKDNSNGAHMAAKEYLPSAFAVRDGSSKQVYPSSSDNAGIFEHGLKVFDREAESLRMFLGNPSIVQVTDNFRQNGTSYYIMEFLDGVNLKALARSMGGKLSAPLALQVLQNTGTALSAVHERGVLHRDVSPENIFVTKQGAIKLIDFGATRFFMGERSSSLSVVLKPGFAPPEQYSSKGNQGPWTDVYALGASFLCVVSGATLPDAPDRLAGATLEPAFASAGLEPGLRRAIEKSLALNYRERYQTAAEFLSEATSPRPPSASQAVADRSEPPLQAAVKERLKGSVIMNLIRCKNGHFYDESRFDTCPHCTSGSVRRDSITMPVMNTGGAPAQAAPIGGNDQKTFSFYSKAMGIEPVVGWLVCVTSAHFGEDFRLKSGRNFIGRGAYMDVVISNDNAVSCEKHAIVVFEPKGRMFLVMPGESKELCYLNNEVVLTPKELNPGDRLTVGETSLMFIPCCGPEFTWDDAIKEGN
jgi:serine/threonine protein kinase